MCHSHGAVCHTGMLVMAVLEANTHPSLHSPDMTPCMSPLPHDSPLIEKPGLGQIQEESEGAGFKAPPGKGLNICKARAFPFHPPLLTRPFLITSTSANRCPMASLALYVS